MVHLIWFHGWGFDSSYFSPLIDSLPHFHHSMIDRGYYSSPTKNLPLTGEPCFAIGHSLGLSIAMDDFSHQIQGYISLCGFYRFCQTPTWPWGIPPRKLARMVDKFQEDPYQVLKDFYHQCDVPFTPPPTFHRERLHQDLKRLQTLDHPRPWPNLIGAIAGERDQITPLIMQQNLYKDLIIIPESGHLPWVNHAPLCAHYIHTLVQRSSG